MRTVNNLRVIDCTHDAENYNEELQDRPPKQQEETYEVNLYRWQIALAMMPSLQVLGAIELLHSIKAIIL